VEEWRKRERGGGGQNWRELLDEFFGGRGVHLLSQTQSFPSASRGGDPGPVQSKNTCPVCEHWRWPSPSNSEFHPGWP
jgi:hypothetical protein